MPRKRKMARTKYNRTISTIRDYPRMCADYERLKREIDVKATAISDMPKGSSGNGSVESKAIKLAEMSNTINAIKEAVEQVPADMQKGIMDNIYYGTAFPLIPSLRSWQREKSKLIFIVADKLNF